MIMYVCTERENIYPQINFSTLSDQSLVPANLGDTLSSQKKLKLIKKISLTFLKKTSVDSTEKENNFLDS